MFFLIGSVSRFDSIQVLIDMQVVVDQMATIKSDYKNK